jgi:hypothetical protein
MQKPPIARRGIALGDPGRVSKSEGSPLAGTTLNRDALSSTKDEQAGGKEKGVLPAIKRAPSTSPAKGAPGFPLKMRGRSPSPALDSLDSSQLQRDTLDLGRVSPEQDRLMMSRLVRHSPSPLRASEPIASGHGGPYLTKGPHSHPDPLPHATLPPVVPYSPFLGPNPLLAKAPIARVPLGNAASSREVARDYTESARGRVKSWHGTGRVAEGAPPALVQEVLPAPNSGHGNALKPMPENMWFCLTALCQRPTASALLPAFLPSHFHTDRSGTLACGPASLYRIALLAIKFPRKSTGGSSAVSCRGG